MDSKLVKLDSNIPLKALLPEQLKERLEDYLCLVITDLLSLKEDSARKLFKSLPSVQKHCWSMGFNEVVKMFTMYADGELSIQPRSNYFDRVLVGQIYQSYKLQKPQSKPVYNYMSQDEKDFIMSEAVDRIAKDYKQHGKITEACFHVYDYLFSKGKLPTDTEYKLKKYNDACLIYSKGYDKEASEYLKVISTFNKQQKNEVKNIAKRLVLEDYYKLKTTK